MSEGRRHVVEVTGGQPGVWTYQVLDPARWSQLSEGERQQERHRAIKRRQQRRRRERMRTAGPQDRYTLEQVGDRDGWQCTICESPVSREYALPHPCAPSVHHLVEVCQGGTNTLDNVAIAHQFCNADSHTWGQKGPARARARLADRVLFGPHGPARAYRVPTRDAVLLAAEIMDTVDQLGPDLDGWERPLPVRRGRAVVVPPEE